jgi:hypothetical protein
MHVDSKKEAETRLNGLKRKYPNIDFDNIDNLINHTQSYLDERIVFQLNFGDENSWRSLVKSSVAYAVYNGISAEQCELALRFLKNPEHICCGYFYQRDLIENRPQNKVFHCLALEGNPKTGMLIGYVEYFSIYRMVIYLSGNYCGNSISKVYGIDPRTGCVLGLKANIGMNLDAIKTTIKGGMIPDGAVRDAMSKVLHLGVERSFELERDRVIDKAVRNGFKKTGAMESDVLTQQQTMALPGYILQELEPFLNNLIKNSKKKR